MVHRPAININEDEAEARRKVVAVAESMLSGAVSFMEGASQILRLKPRIGGIGDRDTDFDAFVIIESETDHLPLEAQWPLWQPQALERLKPDLERAQEWASTFAPAACERLIARFG